MSRRTAGGVVGGARRVAGFVPAWECCAAAGARRSVVENELARVTKDLRDGAAKARERAAGLLVRARKDSGLVRSEPDSERIESGVDRNAKAGENHNRLNGKLGHRR